MTSPAGNGAYLDTTYLRFAKDLRGIHQVTFRFAEVLASDPRFAGTRFVAAEGTFEPYLKPLGIAERDVVVMSPAPLVGRFERFHGLFSDARYRKALGTAPRLLIHPEFRTILSAPVPQAVCFHDFMELEPSTGGRVKWDRRLYFRYKFRRAARARFLMSNSDFTRASALRLFPGIDPRSIRTAHLGVREGLRPAEATRSPAPQPPVCLYIGAYESRKNLPALIRNFRTVAGGTGAVLHLAGHASPETRDALLAAASDAGVRDRITWHGLVSDEELRRLYAASHFLMFPSLQEGFGLPLAEAMSHGLIVFAFRNSSIPEVVGDAGVLAEDGDFDTWGRALADLCGSPEAYGRLAALARERARYFSAEAARTRLGDWLEHVFHACGIAPVRKVA